MAISRSVEDGIATLTMDDGKVNAFDSAFFTALGEALDRCADDAAVVLTGREGMFSAGLNMKVLAGVDGEGLTDLLVEFGSVMHRVWTEPRPVVAAVSGHAIAGGTILAMVCDHTVAAAGDFRWGLTETSIGFPLPDWIIAVARGNVRPDRLDDLLLPGRMVGPPEAVEAGFADVLAEPGDVLAEATARAKELAALPRATYAETKRRLRAPFIEPYRDGMADDIRGLLHALAAP